MTFAPTYPSRERILLFGPGGSGKTSATLHIAKLAAATSSPAHFFYGDSDDSVARMLGSDSYSSLTNLTIHPLYTWDDYTDFAKRVLKDAGPDDWVTVDFIGTAWQAVQDHFTQEVFNKDIGDYFLEARKALSKGASALGALEGWTDWQVINALYRQWITPLLFRGRYHLLATAKVDSLSPSKSPTEDSSTRQLLSSFNSKPVGQKELIYQFHTVLLTGRNGQGQYTLNTVKDRERSELRGHIHTNFALDYLKGVGGWHL
jgi:hypothetical protein